MRYVINFEKSINQFVPHYLSGRKLILYLQSLMMPLQKVNGLFVDWAKETRIEASMTSQKFKLEWFLNRKFKKYFLDASQVIVVKNGEATGAPIYHQSADVATEDNMLLYTEAEGKLKGELLYYNNERKDNNSYSFLVFSPAIDTSLISSEAYLAMLSYYVDKYKIAGKTYKIKTNS